MPAEWLAPMGRVLASLPLGLPRSGRLQPPLAASGDEAGAIAQDNTRLQQSEAALRTPEQLPKHPCQGWFTLSCWND